MYQRNMPTKRPPQPDAPPAAQPGTNMLVLQACAADPMRLAEQAIEQLKRAHPPRIVKTSRKKRKPRR